MGYQIVVNVRSLGRRVTGVERYTRAVISQFGDSVSLVGGSAPQGFRGHLWEQRTLPKLLREDSILWSPANTGPVSVRNQVVTIHDLSVIDHPEWFDRRFAAWYGYFLPRLARIARVVLTDSYHSKIRIHEVFRISSDKIIVAPCGVDRKRFRPRARKEQDFVRNKYGLPEAYGLFVGTLEPRKNLDALIRSWRRVKKTVAPLKLVIAGAGARSFRRFLFSKPAEENLEWVGYVEDRDLPALYSGAQMFIVPSIYEGFGLTALEAMACGAPVIAANSSSLPEVVGEAGWLVDPFDEEEMAAAILALWQNDEVRRDLVQQGYQRAALFPWKRTARVVWKAIELAAEDRVE